MPVKRAFVAVQLPAVLGVLSDALRPLWPARGVAWVRPENLHLTLRFLGAAEDAQIAALRQGLTALAARHEGFTAAIRQSGCFPNRRRPKLIWAGVADADGRLGALQRDVEAMVCAAGWLPEERAFRPHVTLGRVRPGVRPPSSKWSGDLPRLQVPVAAVELIESILKPTGAVHRPLHRAELAKDSEQSPLPLGWD